MQPRRIDEASVMTSLHELRMIGEQRVADERAAHERARAEEQQARQAAEHARLAAAEARERAERDERLRIEQVRVDAEREARLRFEAAQAAEQARHQAELEQQRLHQEMELRRADIAKKRPTWMLAVTIIAIAGGIALAWFAIQSAGAADDAAAQRRSAELAASDARKDADAAKARLDEIERDLAAIDGKVTVAETALATARTKDAREQAQRDIDALHRQEAETRRRIQDAKDAEEVRKRKAGFHPDAKCVASAVGCIDHR